MGELARGGVRHGQTGRTRGGQGANPVPGSDRGQGGAGQPGRRLPPGSAAAGRRAGEACRLAVTNAASLLLGVGEPNRTGGDAVIVTVETALPTAGLEGSRSAPPRWQPVPTGWHPGRRLAPRRWRPVPPGRPLAPADWHCGCRRGQAGWRRFRARFRASFRTRFRAPAAVGTDPRRSDPLTSTGRGRHTPYISSFEGMTVVVVPGGGREGEAGKAAGR